MWYFETEFSSFDINVILNVMIILYMTTKITMMLKELDPVSLEISHTRTDLAA